MNHFSIFGDAEKGQINNLPKAAKEHLITIQFHNQSKVLADNQSNESYSYIQGYMTNEFTYTSTGNYKNIWENAFPENILTRAVSDETQRNLTNYGYLTKKMYTNGESPTITLEFFCYAGDDVLSTQIQGGMTHPVAIGQMLVNATLPKVSEGNFLLSESVVDTAKNVGHALGTLASKIGNAVVDSMTTSASFSRETFESLKGSVDDFTSHKPPVCKLTIGKIFQKDMMVVKRVEVSFSKEFIEPGLPLYGKYNVTFESLYNATNITGKDNQEKQDIFGSGLIIPPNSKSRVTFEDSGIPSGGNYNANQPIRRG